MEKVYDEITEIREVLETKELAPEEYEKLEQYLRELESRKDRLEGKKPPVKTITTDEVVRNKRRMDRKYSRRRKSLSPGEKANVIENKRQANKILRQQEDFSKSGSTYKKLYDEPLID